MVRLFHQEPGGFFRRCFDSEYNGPRLRTVGGDAPKDRWHESVRKRTGYNERVFQYAIRHGLILTNPAGPIERPTVRQPKIQVPSFDQFQQILANIRQSETRTKDR